jgi:hypothetical protein
MSLSDRGIVIVGMNRSGTSSVAGAMEKLGVSFGDPDLLYQADEHNRGGYWEHKAINAAHRKFLPALNFVVPDVDPLPTDWRERPMIEPLIQQTVKTYQQSLSNREIWGWKDPQASGLFPILRECFARCRVDPTVLICVRNPLDVADSQLRRHGTTPAQTIGTWLMNTLSILRDSRGLKRSLIVYERFVLSPRSSLQPAVASLGLHPSEDQWAEIGEWISPDRASRPRDLSTVPEIVRKAYELCLAIGEAPKEFESGEFDVQVEQLWTQWLDLRSLFYRPPLPEATLGLSWERGGQLHRSEALYRPSRSWQTLRGACNALPGSRVSIYLYPLPAIVWVRRAEWSWKGNSVKVELLPGRNGESGIQSGTPQVWLRFGPEQLAVQTPGSLGPYELELEVLIETSNTISGLIFQDMSRQIDAKS